MIFLTNTHDPADVEAAKRSLVLSFEEWQDPDGRERCWQNHLKWLEGKIVGDPQPSEKYTVEQMKEMGLVGVYAPD